ncbi:DICT sensory domain-containing protein [Halolamina rubra]|uniref:DICT sensory domain-containing protein n=1 Tax=Halolamina rubra TaxID=1380430 RepID=UPI0009E3846C|nr:DICT sensory domain-containing protein [Halolamina rubra]
MFDSMLADVREINHRFTVYADGEPSAVDDWFANHRVDVVRRPLPPGGPEPFVAVERNGAFAGVLPLAVLENLLEPPVVRPARTDDLSPAYRALFEVLDETVYRSMDRQELLAVTREIEDRAYRMGEGTLRVGFQRLSIFRTQVPAYSRLAASGVAVHVYGVADWTPPAIPGVTYHASAAGPVGEYWVVAFDGGKDRTQSCALVAREEAEGYSGFWTNDAAVVARIGRRLDAIDADQSPTERDSAPR